MTTNSSPASAKPKNLAVLSNLFPFILPYKLFAIGAGLALIITAGITLALGQGVRLVIDRGFVERSLENLNQTSLIVMGLIVLLAIGTFTRFYLVTLLGERVSADIRKAVFNHVITLHPHYFETNRSGEIMSRLTTDTTLLQNIIGSSISLALRNALMLIGGVVMMVITNLKLSSIVLLGVPAILLPIILFGRRVRRLSRLSQDSLADVGSHAGEVIQHIKTVQSYTEESAERTSFSADVERAYDIAKRRVRQRSFLIMVVMILSFCSIAGMFWAGGVDFLNQTITAGELAAFAFYAIMVAGSVGTLSEVWGEVQRAAGATERLIELLSEKPLIADPDNPIETIQNLPASMSFNDVTFCYPSRPNDPALKNISLTIEEGKSLALVGPSGAGKSTLFELLLRFYDPQQGSILFGGQAGHSIKQFRLQDLRDQIAVVPQQPAMFTADVMYNIRYGNKDASDEAVVAAAKAAYAHEFIESLPDGYQSHLGEQGVRLSGGQKQRLAIARAILNDPRILLLDEATSALDSDSEQKVQLALDELMRNRTTVIIAHRLSTIKNVDRIAVLEHGELVATGKHDSLFEESSLYRRLYQLQFKQSEADKTD